eukprot:m.162414 g.162414  ORF g.162414 m.162414 type:complete len:355 (+) comp38841_c0_seq17:40-1104(+)
MFSLVRQTPFSIPVKSLNNHLTCSLCKGYLVDATAIVECLHTFCRSCIVKYVQSDANRERCPTCRVIIKEAQPMAGLRPDRTLQDIVDKLLPNVHEDEERRKELFMATRHLEGKMKMKYSKPSSSANIPVMRVLPPPDEDKVSLLLKPEDTKNLPGNFLFEKYLRCSARMTVAHLKRFLTAKSNWKDEQPQQLDIFCKGNPLRDELTLEFIWRIRWGNTRQTMVLEYGHRRERPSSPDSPMPEKRRRGRKKRLGKTAAQSPSTNSEGEPSDGKSPAEQDGGETTEPSSPSPKRPCVTTPGSCEENDPVGEMSGEGKSETGVAVVVKLDSSDSDADVVLVKCVPVAKESELTQNE